MEAYQALLTHNLRPAWVRLPHSLLSTAKLTSQLHALYILPSNTPLLTQLYLPSSVLLRQPVHTTLHKAATAEILKTTRRGTISPSHLYAAATEALRALSTLLGEDEWFFGAETPGLFDAEVFAYTYLMLNEALEWRENKLAECLESFGNLVRHRKRLYERCWGTKE